MKALGYAVRVLLLACAYAGSGSVGVALHATHDIVSIIWAPSAIALAVVVLYGPRWWPGVALGTLVLVVTRGFPIGPALVLVAVNVLEVVLGYLVLRALRFRPELDRVRDVIIFVAVVVVITLWSATSSVSALVVVGHVPVVRADHMWTIWWWSHFSSDLLIAPVIMTLTRRSLDPHRKNLVGLEALLIVVAGVGLVVILVARASEPWLTTAAAPYFLMPLLIWASLRFGPRGAALGSFGTSMCAIVAQSAGLAPFSHVLEFQAFIVVSTLSTLMLSALACERRRAVDRVGGIQVASLDAMVTIDQNARITELNPAAEKMFGLRRGTAVGKDVATLVVPPPKHGAFRAGLRRCVRSDVSGGGFRFRTTLMDAKHKTEFPAEIAVAPHQSEGVPRFTGYIRDITNELDAKRALERQVRERTAELVATNARLARRDLQMTQAENLAHLGSFDFDLRTHELMWTDELYRVYGRDRATFTPTFESFVDAVIPSDRKAMRAAIQESIEKLSSFSRTEHIVRPDGQARVLHTLGRVVVGSDGEAERILGCCQDITERAAADEANARLGQLIASSDDAIIGLAPDATIATWNAGAARLFGHDVDEVKGKPITILIAQSERARLGELLEAVRSGEHVAHYEMTHVRRDGTELEASVTASIVLDAAGRVVGMSQVVRDVTGQRLVEAQMRGSLREKEVLLREIHHRVKNNLQVIASLLNLQMAREGNAGALQGLIESQNRIHSMALVHQLLYQSKDLARIEFGEYLAKVTRRLIDTYNLDGGRITVEVSSQPLRLDIDQAIPCGLLVNELVTNALTHAFPEGRSGKIKIALELENDKVTLTVADDGVGLPEHINIDNAHTFGIRIARTLAAQLGGSITFRREGGTVACVEFPMRVQEARE